MDSRHFNGSDDRDLGSRRDAPVKVRMVQCAAGCGQTVRVLTSRPSDARVWCWTCWERTEAPLTVTSEVMP